MIGGHLMTSFSTVRVAQNVQEGINPKRAKAGDMFSRTREGVNAKPRTPQLLFEDRRQRWKSVDPATLWFVMALVCLSPNGPTGCAIRL